MTKDFFQQMEGGLHFLLTLRLRLERLRVGEQSSGMGTHVRENSNKIWFSSHLIVPLYYPMIKSL